MQTQILLIEDDALLQDMYKHVLDKAGFVVGAYTSGKEGLAAFNQTRYDLVLLDIMLPDLDGISALTQMRQNKDRADTKIIMLTNLGQDDVIKKAFELGADSYIIKASMTPYEVVEEIKNLLANTPTNST